LACPFVVFGADFEDEGGSRIWHIGEDLPEERRWQLGRIVGQPTAPPGIDLPVRTAENPEQAACLRTGRPTRITDRRGHTMTSTLAGMGPRLAAVGMVATFSAPASGTCPVV